jgi:hypothetical protein
MSTKTKAVSGKQSKGASPVTKLNVVLPTILILAAFAILPTYFQQPDNIFQVSSANAAEAKPFNTFEEFYPFYLSQHEDKTCRRLHFIGTSIFFFLVMFEPLSAPSLTLAGMMGYVAFFAFRHISHGFFEMGLAFATFLYFMHRLTGKFQKGLMMLIIPYAFAWVGHFMFEHNKPATFVYPIFSLLGDFRLWYEIASRKIAF